MESARLLDQLVYINVACFLPSRPRIRVTDFLGGFRVYALTCLLVVVSFARIRRGRVSLDHQDACGPPLFASGIRIRSRSCPNVVPRCVECNDRGQKAVWNVFSFLFSFFLLVSNCACTRNGLERLIDERQIYDTRL